jgi:hypothetical protein
MVKPISNHNQNVSINIFLSNYNTNFILLDKENTCIDPLGLKSQSMYFLLKLTSRLKSDI